MPLATKPLTADEIAEFMKLGPQFVARLKATIEQQAQQIEKLRGFITRMRRFAFLHADDTDVDRKRHLMRIDALCCEALTATEPINDKR